MDGVVWVLEVDMHEKCDEYPEWTIKGIFTTLELAESFVEESGIEEKDWVITKYELNKGEGYV